MSKLAVVIPTHNRTEPLRRALRSVFSQTRKANQVIVVDDGSDDEPQVWLQREFPDVEVIRQENAGVSAARNRGIRAVNCEWIALLDSDDEWIPQKLERQMSALAAEPEYAISHTDEIWIRDGRRVNAGKRHEKKGGHIFQHCLPLCAISPSSVVLKRLLLQEVGGFDETLPVCEDYDLWLRICSRYPVLFIDKPLVVKYGGHGDQLSKRFWGMDRFRVRALEKIIESGSLHDEDQQAAVNVLLQKLDVYLQGVRKRGRIEEIHEYETIQRRYTTGSSQWQKNIG